jgi:hypothetical protein
MPYGKLADHHLSVVKVDSNRSKGAILLYRSLIAMSASSRPIILPENNKEDARHSTYR